MSALRLSGGIHNAPALLLGGIERGGLIAIENLLDFTGRRTKSIA